VVMRGELSASIAPMDIGAMPLLSAAAWIGVAGSSSAYEFHALHSGQRPSHFVACAPHSTHA